MSEIDDKAFAEYLERSSGLSRQYRELRADEVPPALDERVLREARAAVAKKASIASKSRTLTRWSVPLALAASVVLVVTVIRDTDMHKRAAPGVQEVRSAAPEQYEANRDAAAAPPPAAPVAVPEMPSADAAPKSQFVPEPKREAEAVVVTGNRIQGTPEDAALPVEVLSEPQAKLADLPAPTLATATEEEQVAAVQRQLLETRQDALDSAGAAAPPAAVRARSESGERAVSEIVVTGQKRNAPPPEAVGPRGTITPSPSSDREFAPRPQWELDPSAWLEHIRELRKQNQGARADREWARFREAYPQFEVAENDAARPPRR